MNKKIKSISEEKSSHVENSRLENLLISTQRFSLRFKFSLFLYEML